MERTTAVSTARPLRLLRVLHVPAGAVLVMALVVLLILFAWLVSLQANLPTLRLQQPGGGPYDVDRGVLHPGEHALPDAPIQSEGEWIEQPLREQTWLASGAPGSSLTFRFYGTEAAILTRVGPEASRVYVTIDGAPAPGLPRDERGTYLPLRGSQASNQVVSIAGGLAHREHEIRLTNPGDGEFAVARIIVEARNPFPWAFGMAYVAIIGATLLVVRELALRLAGRGGWRPRAVDPSATSAGSGRP